MPETTPERSALMRRVRREGTAVERRVRAVLTGMGVRYRLNVRGLPGTPDIVNRRARKAVFVHGCFWHFHESCPRGRVPTRNREFWAEKLDANRERDSRKLRALAEAGFDVLVVWECETEDSELLEEMLRSFWFGGMSAEDGPE